MCIGCCVVTASVLAPAAPNFLAKLLLWHPCCRAQASSASCKDHKLAGRVGHALVPKKGSLNRGIKCFSGARALTDHPRLRRQCDGVSVMQSVHSQGHAREVGFDRSVRCQANIVARVCGFVIWHCIQKAALFYCSCKRQTWTRTWIWFYCTSCTTFHQHGYAYATREALQLVKVNHQRCSMTRKPSSKTLPCLCVKAPISPLTAMPRPLIDPVLSRAEVKGRTGRCWYTPVSSCPSTTASGFLISLRPIHSSLLLMSP